ARPPPLELCRVRPPLRARPLAAVPHGAARPSGGVRARGARLRAADADERMRVPAQGADVRARVADRAAGADAARPAARVLRGPGLAPAPALRERRAPPRPVRGLAGADRPGPGLRSLPRAPARSPGRGARR